MNKAAKNNISTKHNFLVEFFDHSLQGPQTFNNKTTLARFLQTILEVCDVKKNNAQILNAIFLCNTTYLSYPRTRSIMQVLFLIRLQNGFSFATFDHKLGANCLLVAEYVFRPRTD